VGGFGEADAFEHGRFATRFAEAAHAGEGAQCVGGGKEGIERRRFDHRADAAEGGSVRVILADKAETAAARLYEAED